MVALFPFNLICENLEECKWNNSKGVLRIIFCAPNTSMLPKRPLEKLL